MKLTAAKPEDEAAVTQVVEAAFVDYAQAMGRPWPGPYPWMASAIADGEVWWLDAPERIGAAMMWRDDDTLYINQIAIEPDQQGKGFGAKALTAIEDKARADGVRQIHLYTAQIFTRLVAFYSREGYRVLRVGPSPSGRDDRLRVFMVKAID